MKQKILIVDDEVSIVTLLTFHVERAGYTVDIAYDGKEAIRKAEQNDYDLMILDLMLPGVDGLQVCKHLRETDVTTPILMLTARDEETIKLQGLEWGADDYLTKPFSPKEVIARIKAILRRVYISKENYSSRIQIGDLIIYPEKHEAELNGEVLTFTRKEFELLVYLAHHKGHVLSRDQLLKAVWNYDFVGDSRIVDVHISHLRDKIEPPSQKPVYIKTVRGLGYKMEDVKQ
ncbi:MAG TPA: response regulator transcription factor [Bacillota bacterium]